MLGGRGELLGRKASWAFEFAFRRAFFVIRAFFEIKFDSSGVMPSFLVFAMIHVFL